MALSDHCCELALQCLVQFLIGTGDRRDIAFKCVIDLRVIIELPALHKEDRSPALCQPVQRLIARLDTRRTSTVLRKGYAIQYRTARIAQCFETNVELPHHMLQAVGVLEGQRIADDLETDGSGKRL